MLFVGALPGGGVLASTACASETRSAALVVDTGEGVSSLCVELPSASVSGTKLIQLAGQQHGLQYRIEGGAVCALAGTGASEGDCFGEYPDFWGYWRGNGSSGWSWSSAGGASTTVQAGDVEGWSWGSGNDGGSHPQPPETRYSSVCSSSPAGGEKPEPETDADGDRGERAEPDDGSPDGSPDEGEENDDPTATTEGLVENDDAGASDADPDAEKKRPKKRKRGTPSVDESEADPPEIASGSADEADERETASTLPASGEADGPPLVGLAGLGAALLLGGAGALVSRRRRSR